MTTIAQQQVAQAEVAIPIKQALPWALAGGLIAVLAYYFVGSEQGATSLFGGMTIWEASKPICAARDSPARS